jgi:pentose-5-phosphate-3-epimerase
MIVAGSAVFKTSDPKAMIEQLRGYVLFFIDS